MNHSDILKNIGLTDEQIELRMGCVGGSDANILLSGDVEKIDNLWSVKTGKSEPEDLSDVIPVIMGQYTEPLNAAWYEKKTGDAILHRGLRVISSKHDFMAANLDGVCQMGTAVWEAKHVNQFSDMNDVLNRYIPQLHHNGFVYECEKAVLSVFKGTLEYHIIEVDLDSDYIENLIEVELRFWECVKKDIPPSGKIRTEKIFYPFEEMRKVSMEGNNQWAAFADTYLKTKEAAKEFETSKKGLKVLVDDDVKFAHGYGVAAVKNRVGNITIKEYNEGENNN